MLAGAAGRWLLPLLPPMLLPLLLIAAPASAAASSAGEGIPGGGDPPPAQYWCPVAQLALDYANHIQPWRSPHLEAFDALGLSTICGKARPKAETSSMRWASRSSRTLGVIVNGAAVVDGTKGSDQTGTGTEARPFKSIARGVATVCATGHAGAKTVIVREGEYHLGGSPLLLGPSASGLTLTAAAEERVVLTGGSAFKPQWQRVSGDSSVHVADIPPALIMPGVKASELLVLSTGKASVGRRMMTARHPNASPYQYDSWQGGLNTASQWGQMSYAASAAGGNQTETVVNKRGLFDRLSARGPYFSGTHGGDVNAFEPVLGEHDGRGCGWAGHVPYHVSQGVIQSCGSPSPPGPPPSPSPPPPTGDAAFLAPCDGATKTQLMQLVGSSMAHVSELKVLDGSNRCLVAAVSADCKSSGPISFLPCDGAAAKACDGAASRWSNTNTDPLKIYRLRSALSGNQCIDSRGDGSISMYTCHHDPGDSHPRRNQEFVLHTTSHLFVAGDTLLENATAGGGWCLASPPHAPWHAPPVISGDTQDKGDPIACGNWSKPSDASLWCNIQWGNKGYAVRSRSGANITFDHGGFQMANGPQTNCASHYLEGIVEALDSPEEFYHDVTASKLFYYPNASVLPADVVMVTDESIIDIRGTQAAPVRDITIQGMTFTGAAKTFLAPHQATTNGADWAAPRRAAVKIEGAHSVVIQQCAFDTLGGSAVLWSDYVRNSSVLNSTFQWLGENGVLAFGTDQFGDVTKGDVPMNNTVESCLFREIGVFAKHSGFYAEFVAGAVRLSNNIAFNGIAMNDNLGGGSEISANLVFNMVRESQDHGPVNSWDRNSYVSLDPATGKPRVNYSETSIHHNLIIAGGMNGNGGEFPIDHDDGSASYFDHHNVLCFGPAKQWQGHSKRFENNLQIFANKGVGDASRSACIDYEAHDIAYGEAYSSNICILGNDTKGVCSSSSSEFCEVLKFRDVCPNGTNDFTAAPLNVVLPHSANNTYYVPGGRGGWGNGKGSCQLDIAGVRARGAETDSAIHDSAELGDARILTMAKALLW